MKTPMAYVNFVEERLKLQKEKEKEKEKQEIGSKSEIKTEKIEIKKEKINNKKSSRLLDFNLFK